MILLLIDKDALIADYESRRPVVVKTEPFNNGDSLVDASLQEITVSFSSPMNIIGYSFSYGKDGKEGDPIKEVIGFSEDKKTIRLKVKLQVAHQYQFVVTTRSFSSEDGYRLKQDYTINFKTK